MGETIRLLAERNITIGAHPSYPDVLGFGQDPLELSDKALEDVILVQLPPLPRWLNVPAPASQQ